MLTNLQATMIDQFGVGKETSNHARQIAGKLFDKAHTCALRNHILAKLTGRTNDLQILSHQPAATRRTNRVITVSLSKIIGSESRSEDFDAGFNPLKQHNRERWIGIAVAHRTGVVLPAVELVRDGNEYYIRDGHHRISVAKAMGQLEIEARVVN
jgi:hypothetical protein